MQQRYQVLLPDWLEDYIIWGAKKYNFSFSELIRVEICLAVLATITEIFPQYKPELTLKQLSESMKKSVKGELEKEEADRLISKLYFETRKAVEYRLAQEAKSKKK